MERWQRFGSIVLSLLAGTALSPTAGAQQPSGTTVRVTPSATASGISGNRTLDVPGDIFSGDEVTTTRQGEAQIRFADDTRFVVGPNSRVVIDKFVFNPNRTAADVSLSAVVGTFRFISGRSRSDAYSIRTPTAVIGVRGTAFEMKVRPGGETITVWLEGTGTICDATGRVCVDVEPGSVTVTPPGGGFATPPPGMTQQYLRNFFPYLGAQIGLDPAFQVKTPGSLNAQGGGSDNGDDGASDDGDDRRDEPRY